MGENAADAGLLVLDYARKVVRYEGDGERWAVPAESVRSFKPESFTPPNGVEFLNRSTVVVLRVDVEGDDEPLVTPLAAHPRAWRPWTPGAREAAARCLRAAIGHLVDPGRWPRPAAEELLPHTVLR